MRIEVIPAAELTPDLMVTWRKLQQTDMRLENPFFCPEFSRAAGCCYPHTFIGVAEELHRVMGFIPFQRRWGRAGRGIAPSAPLVAYQGIVMDPRAEWNVTDLLKGCRLASLEYRHAIAFENPLREYLVDLCPSYVIDLRGGREAYQLAHNDSTLRRRIRQAEKEVGPIRMEADTIDASVFDELMVMKRRQCAQRGWADVFADRSLRCMLDHLRAIRTDEFSGVLSALYIGDTLAAAQFGFRSRTVMHGLFTTYKEELFRYSPGMLMHDRLIGAAESLGITRIDMGYGDESYKPKAANCQVMVGNVLAGQSLPVSLRHCGEAMKQRLKETPLGLPLRAARRGIRGYYRGFRARVAGFSGAAKPLSPGSTAVAAKPAEIGREEQACSVERRKERPMAESSKRR